MRLEQLLVGTLAALVLATLIGQILRRTARSEPARLTVGNVNVRIAAWWVLCGITAIAMVIGPAAVCLEFALFSLLALREFLPRGRSYLVFVLAAAQYLLVWTGRMDTFAAAIPLGGFLLIAAANLDEGGTGSYLERVAEQYWALIVVGWCASLAPALLTLEIPGFDGGNATLLFYLLLVVESGDVLQYIWGKLAGRHPVAPLISPHKTWEGLVGGIVSATALGTALYRATPFRPWQAAAVCLATLLAGFLGGLTMSAIKRQRGIKDFGTLVRGHGGMLDRMDSLCFAAPVFYLLVRYGVAR